MSENEAVLKIIASKTRECDELNFKFKALMIVHTKTVNNLADLSLKHGEMKKNVRELTKIIIQWEKENEILQESLDQAERDIMEMRGL